MSHEQEVIPQYYDVAAGAFLKKYSRRHPAIPKEELLTILENSGLRAVVAGEDLPLGSLGLISGEERLERARRIGSRLGSIKS